MTYTEVISSKALQDKIIAAFGHARFPAGEEAKPSEWNDTILLDATHGDETTSVVRVSHEGGDVSQLSFIKEAFDAAKIEFAVEKGRVVVGASPEAQLMKVER